MNVDKIWDKEMKAGVALLLLLSDGRLMTAAEVVAEMPGHPSAYIHERMYTLINSGHIRSEQVEGGVQTFRLAFQYEKLGGVLMDGRIHYGPCCYNDTYTCMCQLFGEYLREQDEHPCASQRKRDIVCAVLGRQPGTLLPSTDGETIYLRPLEEEDERVRVHDVLHRMTRQEWAEIGTIAADSHYDYQPGFCQVTVTQHEEPMDWQKILTDEGRKDPEMIAGVALMELMSDGQQRTFTEIAIALPDHESNHLRSRRRRFVASGRLVLVQTRIGGWRTYRLPGQDAP